LPKLFGFDAEPVQAMSGADPSVLIAATIRLFP
jgi:hypothetical protein